MKKLKITKAYQTILHEEVSIRDLAFSLGYNDYETFSRAFKKQYYLAPHDLKSVGNEIRSQMQSEEHVEIMFISVDEDTSDEEIKSKFQQMVKERGFSIDEIPDATAFRVERLSDQQAKAVSIRKKLKITSDDRLWKILVDEN